MKETQRHFLNVYSRFILIF